ncbi:MAG: DUF1624 domain-containing protein [Myxococcaceae bacterium]|nr:DUF1624 domain-containing protein [Myxococcaceae bacterium]
MVANVEAPVVPAQTRVLGLDAARALATFAMVIGHTADGLLSDAARELPWVKTYWSFRGLTAPLFLFVAGWAVVASVQRDGKTGWALIKARAGRVALLFALGIALRWPGWNVSGVFTFDREVWRHLTGFDALHAVGGSLLLGVLLFSVVRTPRARTAALFAAGAFFPLVSTAVWVWAETMPAPLTLHSALVGDGESPFPLFPWAGYFFCGALTGQVLSFVPKQASRTVALIATGAACVALCAAVGLRDLTQTSPTLFFYRLGQVWIVVGTLSALPMSAAVWLSPLGRSSLVMYVAHLPIVYGWSTIPGLSGRYGRVLSPLQVIAVAAVLLLFGFTLARLLRRAKKWLRARATLPRRETPDINAGAVS